MRNNEILADFTTAGTYFATEPLYQYDHGMVLRIAGTEITEPCTVHFAASPDKDGSYQVIGTIDAETGDLLADIPDNLLGDDASSIWAWVYYSSDTSGYTVYRIYTPVVQRARPDGYVPTEAEWDSFNEALNAVREAAEAVKDAEEAIEECILKADITEITGGHRLTVTDKDGTETADILNGLPGEKGEKGDIGSQGPKGDPGNDGFSPQVWVEPVEGGNEVIVRTIDGYLRFTIYDGAQGIPGPQGPKGDTGSQGPAGSDGQDGYSPTVTITQISGGHRITITDKNGSHSADVMDGVDGQDGTDGRGIVSITKTGTSGLVDTYTITYTDNTTSTFTVTNGEDGDDYVLTNQDKQDIADIVLGELPTWQGGSY